MNCPAEPRPIGAPRPLLQEPRSGSVRVRRRPAGAGLTPRKNNSPVEVGVQTPNGSLTEHLTPLLRRGSRARRIAQEPVPGRLRLASVEACERQSWTLLLWHKGGEGRSSIVAAPYRCGSWRCRRCAWAVARDDHRRIARAVIARPWWLYAVLTFDPREWRSAWDAYAGGARLWDKRLRRRLERSYGRLEYVQTWERHLNGWPHLNVLLRSPALEDHVRALPERFTWTRSGNHGRGRLAHSTRWRRWLAAIAPACGFGMRVWVEVVDSKAAISAYLVKVADEMSRATFKTGNQSPIGAPPHFRRLRTSRGLLPPRTRCSYQERVDDETGEVTSWLEEKRVDAPSDWTGVLSPRPQSEFETREPTWTEVADAWEFQANAWKRRREVAPPSYEG